MKFQIALAGALAAIAAAKPHGKAIKAAYYEPAIPSTCGREYVVEYDNPMHRAGTYALERPPVSADAPQATSACPMGFHIVEDRCVKIVTGEPKRTCPNGYEPGFGIDEFNCLRVLPKLFTCPVGFHSTPKGTCKAVSIADPVTYCPDGFHPTHDGLQCGRIVVQDHWACPEGSIERGSACVTVTRRPAELVCDDGELIGRQCRVTSTFDCTPITAEEVLTCPHGKGKCGKHGAAYYAEPAAVAGPAAVPFAGAYPRALGKKYKGRWGGNYVRAEEMNVPDGWIRPTEAWEEGFRDAYGEDGAYNQATFGLEAPEVINSVCRQHNWVPARRVCPLNAKVVGDECLTEHIVDKIHGAATETEEYALPTFGCPDGYHEHTLPSGRLSCERAAEVEPEWYCPAHTIVDGDRCIEVIPQSYVCDPGFILQPAPAGSIDEVPTCTRSVVTPLETTVQLGFHCKGDKCGAPPPAVGSPSLDFGECRALP